MSGKIDGLLSRRWKLAEAEVQRRVGTEHIPPPRERAEADGEEKQTRKKKKVIAAIVDVYTTPL